MLGSLTDHGRADDDSADLRVVQYIDDVDHNETQLCFNDVATVDLIYSGTLSTYVCFATTVVSKIRGFNCTLSRGNNKQTCFLIIFTLIKFSLLSDPGPYV